jgi:hypothetical protein
MSCHFPTGAGVSFALTTAIRRVMLRKTEKPSGLCRKFWPLLSAAILSLSYLFLFVLSVRSSSDPSQIEPPTDPVKLADFSTGQGLVLTWKSQNERSRPFVMCWGPNCDPGAFSELQLHRAHKSELSVHVRLRVHEYVWIPGATHGGALK